MAEEFVTEEELLGGDPELTADSTQEDTQTFTFYAGDEAIRGVSGLSYLANQEGYMEATVDDLQEYYNSADRLQQTFGTFENYLNYMTERESLIQSGEYNPGEYGDIVDTGMVQNVDGTMIDPDDIQNLSPNDFISKYGIDKSELQIVEVETTEARGQGYKDWLNSDAVQNLNAKYGISNVLQTDDGREYMWNGSAWVKTKDKETFDFGDALKLVAAVGMTTLIGGAVAGKLAGAFVNAGMSQAAASAASKAIINAASQLAMTGEVDITQAALSAAGAYLDSAGFGNVLGDSEVGQALADIGEQAQDKINTFKDAISTGSSIADAAIQAGGMSMLISLVEEGEIDVQQAIIAAGMAGGTEFLNQLAASGAVTQEEIDQYQEMGPPEELAGTDLDGDGITDTEVGDGLFLLSDGTVVNADNETIGTMNELDINNDGQLTGEDLQEITVDAQPIGVPSAAIKEGVRYYKDQNGNLVAQGDITGLKVDRDTGNYIDTDGNVYVYAGQGNAAGEVFDPYNGILTASDGRVLAVYDPDVGWVDTEGNYVGATKEEYLNYLSSGDPSGATQGFGITREEYDSMTGPELVDDLFVQRGENGQLTISREELAGLMQKFDSVEEFEQYMQEQGIGVNVSGNTVVLVGGALDGSDEGIWNITDGTNPVDLYGEPSEFSGTLPAYTESSDIYDAENSPFTEELVESEPVKTEDQTDPESDILDSTDTTLKGATGDPAAGAQPGGSSLENLQQQYENAVNAGNYSLAVQIAIQMRELQQPTVDLTDTDSTDTQSADGTFQQPTGSAPPPFTPEDTRTEWQKYKDYIVSLVSAGEATAEQLEWYERWQEAGSPETQGGMDSGTDAEEGVSTGDDGGLTGDTEEGGSSEVTDPSTTTGVDGATTGTDSSDKGLGMLDAGTGDPDTGDGSGGTGEGGTGDGGMLTQQTRFQMPDFKPLYTTIEYNTPTIQPIIVDNRKDYVRELDALIDRGLFTSQKGIA